MFQMVGSTRGTPSGFGARGSGTPPPPPPPSGIAEVLAAQTQLLQQLVQAQQQRGEHNAHHPQEASYQDFLSTQPPLFNKFSLLTVPCSEASKARFAAQQLRGPARMWWVHYHGMLPADHVVSWNEFQDAFRAHHIPMDLLDRKLNEFLALTQAKRTVLQYAQAFNHLCQYASYHKDTDAKKHDCFRQGLSTNLQEWLNLVCADSYNELVNLAINQEDLILAHRADKKRKAPAGPSSAC